MAMTKYKKFYAFGCSWTNYIWPTWADIVSYDLQIPFENWGLPGLGNFGIHARLVECDLKNKLSTDDLVILQWSSWVREDRYINGRWISVGNIFNNDFYDESFLNKYWSWDNDLITNSTAIYLTNKAYKDMIGLQISMCSFSELSTIDDGGYIEKLKQKLNALANKQDQTLSIFYKNNIPTPNSLYSIYTKNSKFKSNCLDAHPDILCHLNFVEEIIYPNLGLELKTETKNRYLEMSHRMEKSFNANDSFDIIREKSYKILKDMGINIEKMQKKYGY